MTVLQRWITIGAVWLGTMITRFLAFFLFPQGKKVPDFIRYLGRVLPSAAMGLLVVYCLREAPFTAFRGLPEAIASAVVVLLHVWKGHPLLSIGAGTVTYMLLIQLVFC